MTSPHVMPRQRGFLRAVEDGHTTRRPVWSLLPHTLVPSGTTPRATTTWTVLIQTVGVRRADACVVPTSFSLKLKPCVGLQVIYSTNLNHDLYYSGEFGNRRF